MTPSSSSSGRARGFLKRVVHGTKKLFKSTDQATTPHTPSPPRVPPEDPSPQPTATHESTRAILPQALARPQPAAPSQDAPTPTPSTSLQLATTGSQLDNAESSQVPAMKKAGADAWTGLKGALRLLEKSSSVFPPLKSAVAELLGVVDIFESAAQNRKNYAELGRNLRRMVDEFQEHPGDRTSSNMSEALRVMANDLQKEMEHVQQRQGRSGLKRHLEAGQDVVDVRECYRRVENLRRALQHKELVKILDNQTNSLDKILGNQENQDVEACFKELNAALKAMYDSSLADVVGRRTCTPGTREKILQEMRQWANDSNGPKVYWLNGMAGTGKTTLAYSFCEEMQLAGRLGASFFCSRTDADSREVSKIVPTIAHQLARLLPSYREVLIRQINGDKDIGARNTKAQFEKLIRDPLREVETSEAEGIVVTIDALDECERRDGARDILQVLFRHARDLPIKFLVTCRPEPGLFDVLQSKDEYQRSVLHLHDIETSFVQADIKKYLEAELADVSLAPEKLGMLAEQAGTLFIYAATAVRYIYPQNRQVNVQQRLESLLSMASKPGINKHKGIDELYTAVLSVPFADKDLEAWEKENIRLVLDTTICAREPMSVATMAKLLELDDEQDVTQALQHLRSVLHVSYDDNIVSTLHASFPDFMLDQSRSKNLNCSAPAHNQRLASGCFSTMQRLLRFNICDLESSFVLDENIRGLTTKINKAISPELLYACRYWGVHLEFAESLNDVHSMLEDFLSNRLLFWMEVLNLGKCIGAGVQMLTGIHAWLQKLGGAGDVLELALDASRFVTAFGLSSASRSTPHIYISALPFWPETRPVRLRYWKRTRGLIRLEGSGMEGRDLSCLATWDTGSGVWCVSFSPDGTRIVSGSWDGAIRVWDAHTGLLVAGPFEGHTCPVISVAFSPDGACIVSGSGDDTIRVWDSRSGLSMAGSFEGHTQSISSVTFSPDGTRIVSGSSDNTICVWDAHSGDLVAGPFEGHTDSVRCVAFSPDGTCIISGSWDETIRVWDARNGDLVAGPFKGHNGWVSSIAFSPDGSRIVSGSHDKTIRVWDSRSGDLVAGPLTGHTHPVRCVAFSPNGTRIVSSSNDHTVRIWDATSGDLVAGPFEAHTDEVSSVAFSPDGTRIVSGSDDNTIRVWDSRGEPLVAEPFEGHNNSVSSVAFSPDGSRIASGSRDKTICVWDAYNGDLVAGPFKGHGDRVFCVSFSPEGTRIATGSYDNTICVWDASRGDLVAGPFKGHTDSVYSVSFSSDGTRIVSGSRDKTICVWDAYSENLVTGPLKVHDESVYSVAFSPDGTRIVSGSSDNTICVWDTIAGVASGWFEGHRDWVSSVAFSPDGTRVVSGSGDCTIRVWDASTGALVAGPFEGHVSHVESVRFSPDGTHVVSGSHDKTVRVWNASSGDLVAGPFEGHTDSVNSVRFSPDGCNIVSGSSDRTIRVWSIVAPYTPDSRDINSWLMNKTGMITSRQGQLMLCVPTDLWTGLVRPENVFCIRAKGVLKLNFDDVLSGNMWMKCYQC